MNPNLGTRGRQPDIPLTLPVSDEFDGERLDRFLVSAVANHSRSQLQKLIEDGHVTVDGRAAKAMGLVHDAVPASRLDATVEALAARMAGVPKNQLMMQKLMINQAYENMGLANTQMIATVLDRKSTRLNSSHT